jgi:hypothetical protein
MVNWDITVGGVTLNQIFDVQYDNGESKKLGEATIVCGNNINNRSVESGDEVEIVKNGETDFKGYVTGKPTKAGATKTEIEIKVVDKRAELKYQQVNRVFYQEDTGDIIRKVLDEKLVPYTLDSENYGNFIHKGESKDNGSTDIPKFSLAEIVSVSLEEVGNGFLFFGWPAGSSNSPYHITVDNLPDRTIPGDGKLDTFYTRMVLNNKGDMFTVEIDLRDEFGNNYIWNPELPESEFKTYELKAEEAVSESSIGEKVTTDGTLQYRFNIDGSVPDSRGLGIDFSSTIPFSTTSRETDLSPAGVQQSGNVITRRIERSAFEMIKEFSTEDEFIFYVDMNDILYYEPPGQNEGLDIDYNNTTVVDASFDRDYKDITNRVTVQGDEDIRVTVEDSSSVNFYGISSREEPIIDKAIQTEKEAKRRGEGYLKENAWDDEALEFVIANSDYQTLSLGDNVYVNWPPESITGTYTVSNVETNKEGLVTINLTKRGTL